MPTTPLRTLYTKVLDILLYVSIWTLYDALIAKLNLKLSTSVWFKVALLVVILGLNHNNIYHSFRSLCNKQDTENGLTIRPPPLRSQDPVPTTGHEPVGGT